jgi:hypothetical protein
LLKKCAIKKRKTIKNSALPPRTGIYIWRFFFWNLMKNNALNFFPFYLLRYGRKTYTLKPWKILCLFTNFSWRQIIWSQHFTATACCFWVWKILQIFTRFHEMKNLVMSWYHNHESVDFLTIIHTSCNIVEEKIFS